MAIRVKKEELFKCEKLEVPKDIKEKAELENYELDTIGDAFILMPKMASEWEEDKKIKNNIKKEWLEP